MKSYYLTARQKDLQSRTGERRHLSWFAVFQIVCATIDNNKIILDIDNSRMAADDFRVK